MTDPDRTLSATDPDGQTLTESFGWTNLTTGASLGSGSSITLDATVASPADEIQCMATVSDSSGGTDSDTASVIVANTAPTVTSVSINPNTGVTSGSLLTCSMTLGWWSNRIDRSGSPKEDNVSSRQLLHLRKPQVVAAGPTGMTLRF